jgi:uncharacterized damage-inducible protein DinB
MQPDTAKAIADFLLDNFEGEIPTTAAVFAAVPQDKLSYRPDNLAKTSLGLLRHLTLEDEWMLNAVAHGAFAPLPDDSDACGLMTPHQATECYRDRIAKAIARVRALSGEELLRDMDLFGQWRMPALQWLSVALRHSAHHRGQLSTYLRPMGSKVPPIYGPSADTQSMMEQQAS